MAETSKQQGKGRSAASDAPTSEVVQTNAPVGGDNEPETTWKRGPDAHFDRPTPVSRAKAMVHSGLTLFDVDDASIARQVSALVTASIEECPKEELAAFRSEGKL